MRLHNPPVIAVIEDDKAMREALAELLEVFSLVGRTFDRAEAFLAALSHEQFDCLITDLHLPGLSGLELQQRLNAQGSPIPVILITSSQETHHRVQAIEGGASAYLTKPFSDEILISHVTAALERTGRSQKQDEK
jgi:FixJ family two-component response regulator